MDKGRSKRDFGGKFNPTDDTERGYKEKGASEIRSRFLVNR